MEKGEKFVALFLVFSLLSLSVSLCAKERRGADLVITKIVKAAEAMKRLIRDIQSFGSRINLHPHLHLPLKEGGEDQHGQFHKVSRFEESVIAKFICR